MVCYRSLVVMKHEQAPAESASEECTMRGCGCKILQAIAEICRSPTMPRRGELPLFFIFQAKSTSGQDSTREACRSANCKMQIKCRPTPRGVRAVTSHE